MNRLRPRLICPLHETARAVSFACTHNALRIQKKVEVNGHPTTYDSPTTAN